MTQTTDNWRTDTPLRQSLPFDGGMFTLTTQSAPGLSGRYLVELQDLKGVPGFPKFFLSAANAKTEIDLWLENWRSLTEPPDLHTFPVLGPLVHSVLGRNCELSLFAINNREVTLGRFLCQVAVHVNKEPYYPIAWESLFPRCYFNLDIAISEMTAWMILERELPPGAL